MTSLNGSEYMREYMKQYRINNPEYYEKQKQNSKYYVKKHREQHPENKEKEQEYNKNYLLNKYSTDTAYREQKKKQALERYYKLKSLKETPNNSISAF